jgi:hypothetical protein
MILPTLLLEARAEAPGPPPRPPITLKVSGLIFPRYTYDFSADANEFALDRTYLRAEARVGERWGGRITIDSKRGESEEVALDDGSTLTIPANERYVVFVKHAWIEWKGSETLVVRGGIIDTPMVTFVGSNRNIRWINKTFIDEVDLASSADLGINVAGSYRGGLLSWCAGVYNGETYKSPESGSGKSIQARFTVDPLAARPAASLQLTAFGDLNFQDDTPPITAWAGDAMFRVPNLSVGAQVAGRVQGSSVGLGQSGVLAPGIPTIGYLFARVDHWDPDVNTPDDDQLTILAGPAHDFYEKISLGLFYRYETEAATPGVVAHSVSLQGQLGF